ncbi:MAG: UbiD family decarboxylase [Phycisphaeraceae bacterium]|nr:UbiD family decarboxylase [Phycisphaeraceae bacterium]
MYPSLRDFLSALEKAGQLHRVSASVSPILEIAEIADRVSKSPAARVSEFAAAFDPQHCGLGGKALWFENVQGSSFPLVINVFGSYQRTEMALGCHAQGHTPGGFAALAGKIAHIAKPQPPTGLLEKIKKGLEFAKLASAGPHVVRNGPCQEVIKTGSQVNLFELPILQCWPHDGDPTKVGFPLPADQPIASSPQPSDRGRYITFAGVYTIHPDDAAKPEGEPRPSRNVGMYRCQLIDQRRTAMHWHMHHDGARHWRAWKERRAADPSFAQRYPGMPCALALGGESVLPYAATAPMPPGLSELLLAGVLQGGGIPLVPCKTIDLHVPAHAEIIIEGYVSTDAGGPGYDPRRKGPDGQPLPLGPGAFFEGPFGDHTGFYSLPDRYPIFEVTAITHRRDAIYPATIVGLPPQEDYYLGKATERIFLPLLQTIVPDILDYHLPMFGAFHNCVFVKIRKEYPLHARRVMHAIWGAGQMSWTKFIIVVDHDVDVHDQEQVLFHLCANCAPGRDVELVTGPLDILDHAAPHLGSGQKMGFDATRKIPGEQAAGQPVRDYPEILRMDPAIKAQVQRRWSELGLS